MGILRINDKPFFLRLLVDPGTWFRVLRYSLLWASTLLLIYRGFGFIATSIPDAASPIRFHYSLLSTLLFGGLTIGAYVGIAFLIHRFLLQQFRLSQFMLGVLGVHLIASELVLAHFHLFYAYLPPSILPRFYAMNAEHIHRLAFWQAPFDPIIVWLFSFSLFYNYLLYAVGLKVFKDLFTIQLQRTELEKENLRLEFNFLKAQINPHFLFNTLNNIYSFSIRSPDKVATSILKLSDMMRYTLYETNEERVLLTKEIAFLTSYIDLQRIRYDDHVRIELELTGQPTQQVILPLLLIVFIENAFKHGIETTAQASWVRINLNIQAHRLSLAIANSVPTRISPASPGIGLNNVQKRLAFYYPAQHTLTIHPAAYQYSIHLTLDLDEAPLPSHRAR